jgi:quinol monooxygenase YgiN
MAEHAQIIRLARYRPDPGQRETMLAQLQEQVQAMRSLPGLFGAQVCTSQEDPDVLIVVSRWENEIAMRGQGRPQVGERVQAAAELAEREKIEHLFSL